MPPRVEVALLSVAGTLLVVVATFIVLRVRGNPLERERRRRLDVNREGRLGDGTITEMGRDAIYYSYCVGGVEYAASQDTSQLRDRLPAGVERLIGYPVSLKYAPRNPANSILICEEWSGLRAAPPAAEAKESSPIQS